jgi:superfamily II DNA or RNA helicase
VTQPAAGVGLRSLGVSPRYRSNRDNVVEHFYVPCLNVATGYSRAVGYFTSTSLALFSRGLDKFVEREGTMRLIASPHLNADDILDIERGYDVRDVINRSLLREIEADDRPTVLQGLGVVGRLVAEGRLDIKLAFVEQAGRIGIYHEKLGVFRDEIGDLIAFTGSSNETYGGLMANFESIEVYLGWVMGDGARALAIEQDFEDLWHDRTENLTVEAFPDVARERLIERAGRQPRGFLPPTDDALLPGEEPEPPAVGLSLPAGLEVRDYQRQAVEAWLRNRGRGILKMATGTGKTKTALTGAFQLGRTMKQNEQPLVILIVAPLKHLVDQWLDEIAEFGVNPIAVYENSSRWMPLVEQQLNQARLGQRPVVAMVATNDSFSSDRMQSILGRITMPFLIIADEAHNLGSKTYRDLLPPNANYRLALSATPERWFDETGTDALVDYFGPVVFELTLGQAIEMGALCHYRYTPRLIELTDDENTLYVDLTAQIAKLMASGQSLDDDPDSPIGLLLGRRAAILGHAEGKLAQLYTDLDARRDGWFQLVYCGEGRRPELHGIDDETQVSKVLDLVGNHLGLSAHSYIASTSRPERRRLLERFAAGDDLKVLVAIRCLDEGVDIPDARTAYLLASSSNPRQFIQRRGRILRRSPDKTHAEIVDYLAVPQSGTPVNFLVERGLLIRELQRANEFAKLSDNYEDTLALLRPLKEQYQLMDM